MSDDNVLTSADEVNSYLARKRDTNFISASIRHRVIAELPTENYIVQGANARVWSVSIQRFQRRPDGTEYSTGSVLGAKNYITEDKVFFSIPTIESKHTREYVEELCKEARNRRLP